MTTDPFLIIRLTSKEIAGFSSNYFFTDLDENCQESW